jgi:uncharacterized protein YcbX
MAERVGTVASLWRYPVKSMLGEQLDEADLTSGGIVGDRAYALVDTETGQVVSAKHPRKWGALLGYRAEFVEAPTAGGPIPPVGITFPDGTAVRSDDAGVDGVLSEVLGRAVELRSAAPAGKSFEEVWPDIDGLAPPDLIDATRVDDDLTEPGGSTSRLPLGLDAPAESFFDLARLHLLTTSTLEHLGALYPEGRFDVRRYRPNVLVDTSGASGFVENDWAGAIVELGNEARAAVSIPTMRCIMTTLGQQGLPHDPKLLETIAQHNRLEIEGLGSWACAGVYAGVDRAGTVRVGDPVAR